ncbi:hypothetical protein AVEN_20131-1 [Araneus ventricosus]|uniref:Uncharacterized protein n=1 Tax=Araneus ventricosus TaxID=182803 RepID=A0A4Y2VI07_ARAVE|nr:hypothetical protein AVEN_20131-1 [Araneus ventricosus]
MSVNLNLSILGSSKDVKTGFRFSRRIVQHFGCHTRHSICDPNFECTIIFSWRCKHSVLYVTSPKVWITDAVSSVTAEILDNTPRESESRLDILRATKDAQVQIY